MAKTVHSPQSLTDTLVQIESEWPLTSLMHLQLVVWTLIRPLASYKSHLCLFSDGGVRSSKCLSKSQSQSEWLNEPTVSVAGLLGLVGALANESSAGSVSSGVWRGWVWDWDRSGGLPSLQALLRGVYRQSHETTPQYSLTGSGKA